MNGQHDLGGQMGFGPVRPEPEGAPAFHAGWERRALGVTLCAGALGRWTLDESRHARESLHPAVYYNSSYFEIWIRALEALLKRHGVVTQAELAAGRAQTPAPDGVPAPLRAADVPAALAAGGPTARPIATAPRFAPGARVRARNFHPVGHTRLPRYVRGHVGTVIADHGGHVFPDSNAHGGGEAAQRLYTVGFDATELWGPDADPSVEVTVDAWESYLDAV